jgi:hypothetical protein
LSHDLGQALVFQHIQSVNCGSMSVPLIGHVGDGGVRQVISDLDGQDSDLVGR